MSGQLDNQARVFAFAHGNEGGWRGLMCALA